MQALEIIMLFLICIWALGAIFTMDQLLTHEGCPGDLGETVLAILFCLFWPVLLVIGITAEILEWAVNARNRRG